MNRLFLALIKKLKILVRNLSEFTHKIKVPLPHPYVSFCVLLSALTRYLAHIIKCIVFPYRMGLRAPKLQELSRFNSRLLLRGLPMLWIILFSPYRIVLARKPLERGALFLVSFFKSEQTAWEWWHSSSFRFIIYSTLCTLKTGCRAYVSSYKKKLN